MIMDVVIKFQNIMQQAFSLDSLSAAPSASPIYREVLLYFLYDSTTYIRAIGDCSTLSMKVTRCFFWFPRPIVCELFIIRVPWRSFLILKTKSSIKEAFSDLSYFTEALVIVSGGNIIYYLRWDMSELKPKVSTAVELPCWERVCMDNLSNRLGALLGLNLKRGFPETPDH